MATKLPLYLKHLTYPLATALMLLLGQCRDDNFPAKAPRLDYRLDYYIETYEVPGLEFDPQTKVTYHYDDSGILQSYTVLSYNPSTGLLEEQRHFDFSYSNGKVAEIKEYLADDSDPHIEYSYAYSPDGQVTKITEWNHAAGVDSDATFTYSQDSTIIVNYEFSNGESFKYEFDFAGRNIISDKTTRGEALCSNGQYTYDQKKNPFNMLGYTDYYLTNFSSNNKVTEDVSYLSCAFPTLIPQSYAYEYNNKGYPVAATTFYKDSETKSRREFFYVSQR